MITFNGKKRRMFKIFNKIVIINGKEKEWKIIQNKNPEIIQK